ncbi:MAG: large subunit ribosomal protein L15e [Thermoproteota archaeon]|nr:large subunit ribosomal protein L15e [Thermoproteota archaeon]
MYKYITNAWKDLNGPAMKSLMQQRTLEWRGQTEVVRVDDPLRLDRARKLGYKAKQGFVIARVRVRRGGMRRAKPAAGRRQRRLAFKKSVPAKSMQLIGEERTSKRFPNLEVLNSYWVGEDGQYKWYEIILVDPSHPSIEDDPDINWICDSTQKGRANRGLTSQGKKARGL